MKALARGRVAGIVGAGVPIVANRRRPDALPAQAGVVYGAGVSVVARGRVVRVKALARGRVAGIVGAGVPIVANRRRPDALPAQAVVPGGAGVAVRAVRPVVRGDEDTPLTGVTQVVRARVLVVAGDGLSGAGAACAVIQRRAVVLVVAGCPVGRRRLLARPGRRHARRDHALLPDRLFAMDHGGRVHDAGRVLAPERPVAQVPVLVGQTVRVGLALAHRGPHAVAVVAKVVRRAPVPVVAWGRVVREHAPDRRVARIVRAGIVVVARDRVPPARPPLAEPVLLAQGREFAGRPIRCGLGPALARPGVAEDAQALARLPEDRLALLVGRAGDGGNVEGGVRGVRPTLRWVGRRSGIVRHREVPRLLSRDAVERVPSVAAGDLDRRVRTGHVTPRRRASPGAGDQERERTRSENRVDKTHGFPPAKEPPAKNKIPKSRRSCQSVRHD